MVCANGSGSLNVQVHRGRLVVGEGDGIGGAGREDALVGKGNQLGRVSHRGDAVAGDRDRLRRVGRAVGDGDGRRIVLNGGGAECDAHRAAGSGSKTRAAGIGLRKPCSRSDARDTDGAERLLVTVRFEAALLVLIAWLGKLIAAGEIVTGITPLPVSETLCGEFAAESVTTRVEGKYPFAVGANVTEMVHCALGARLVPQLLVWE